MRTLETVDKVKFQQLHNLMQLDTDGMLEADTPIGQTIINTKLSKHCMAESIVMAYLDVPSVDFEDLKHQHLLQLTLQEVLNPKAVSNGWKDLPLEEQSEMISLLSCQIDMQNRIIEMHNSVKKGMQQGLALSFSLLPLIRGLPVPVEIAAAVAELAIETTLEPIALKQGMNGEFLEKRFQPELFTQNDMDYNINLDSSGMKYVIKCLNQHLNAKTDVDDCDDDTGDKTTELNQEFIDIRKQIVESLSSIKKSKQKISEEKHGEKFKKYAGILASVVATYYDTKENSENLKKHLEETYDVHQIRLDITSCYGQDLPSIQENLTYQLRSFAHYNLLRQEQFFNSLSMRMELIKAKIKLQEGQCLDAQAKIAHLHKKQMHYITKLKHLKGSKIAHYAQGALAIAGTLSLNPIASGIFALGGTALQIFSSNQQKKLKKKTKKYQTRLDNTSRQMENLNQEGQEFIQMIKAEWNEIDRLRDFLIDHEEELDPSIRRIRLKEEIDIVGKQKNELEEKRNTLQSSSTITTSGRSGWDQTAKSHVARTPTTPGYNSWDRATKSHVTQTITKETSTEIERLNIDIKEKEALLQTKKQELEYEEDIHLKAAKDWAYQRRKALAVAGFDGLDDKQREAKERMLDAHRIMMTAYHFELESRQYRVGAMHELFHTTQAFAEATGSVFGEKPKQALILWQAAYESWETLDIIVHHTLPKFSTQVVDPSQLRSWYVALNENAIDRYALIHELISPSINALTKLLSVGVAILCKRTPSDKQLFVSALNHVAQGLHEHLSKGFCSIEKEMNEITKLTNEVLVRQNRLMSAIQYSQEVTQAGIFQIIRDQEHSGYVQSRRNIQIYVNSVTVQYNKALELIPRIRYLQEQQSFLEYFCALHQKIMVFAKQSIVLGEKELNDYCDPIIDIDPKYFISAIAINQKHQEILPNYPYFIAVLQVMETLLSRSSIVPTLLPQDRTELLTSLDAVEKEAVHLNDFITQLSDIRIISNYVQILHDCYCRLYEKIIKKRKDYVEEIQGAQDKQRTVNVEKIRTLLTETFIGADKFYFSELVSKPFRFNIHGNIGRCIENLIRESNYWQNILPIRWMERPYMSLEDLSEPSLYDLINMLRYQFSPQSTKYIKPSVVTLYISPQTRQWEMSTQDRDELDSPIKIRMDMRDQPQSPVEQIFINNQVCLRDLSFVQSPDSSLNIVNPMAVANFEESKRAYNHVLNRFIEEYLRGLSNNEDRILVTCWEDDRFVPLHFPRRYINSIQAHSKVQRILSAQDLGVGLIDYRYQFTPSVQKNGDLIFQLKFIFVFTNQAYEHYSLVDFVVAEFNPLVVNAYKKIVYDAQGYHYVLNVNEFLLLCMYGTPEGVGIPAGGSYDLDERGTICPVETPFIGLYPILEKISSDSIFSYRSYGFDKTTNAALETWVANGEISQLIKSFIPPRDERSISIHPGYQRLLNRLYSMNQTFYDTQLKTEFESFGLMNDLYQSYKMLLAIIRLTTALNNGEIIQLLEDKVRIFHPYVLKKLAEIDLDSLIRLLKSISQPTFEEIEQLCVMLNASSQQTCNLKDIEDIQTVIAKWKLYLEGTKEFDSTCSLQGKSCVYVAGQDQENLLRDRIEHHLDSNMPDIWINSHCDSLDLDLSSTISVRSTTAEPRQSVEEKQTGWNCFDIALGLRELLKKPRTETPEAIRKALVDKLLEKQNDPIFRKLLAPEIRNALYVPPKDEHGRRIPGGLPDVMRTSKLQELIIQHQCGLEAMRPCNSDIVKQCNDKLAHGDGRRLTLEQLEGQLPILQREYPEVYKDFLKERNRLLTPSENALNEYCDHPDTYVQYLREYYGKNEWFAFQRIGFSGEQFTSIIDAIAHLFEIQITIVQANKIIASTKYAMPREERYVSYNGINHFERYEKPKISTHLTVQNTDDEYETDDDMATALEQKTKTYLDENNMIQNESIWIKRKEKSASGKRQLNPSYSALLKNFTFWQDLKNDGYEIQENLDGNISVYVRTLPEISSAK